MPPEFDSVEEKVRAIFSGLAGDRAKSLDGAAIAHGAMDAITDALSDEYGVEKAADIAFHMADWNGDAAFVVALHLFPERFTPDEINDGLLGFLVHAPNHIVEACRLTGTSVREIFSSDDGTSSGTTDHQ